MKNEPFATQDMPPCGYGRIGLCCSACLSGPCRISPFEPDAAGARCGVSPDQLVAARLLRMIASEAAARLSLLAQRIGTARRSDRRPAGDAVKPLALKYGLDADALEQGGGCGRLAAEMEGLLALAPAVDKPNPLLGRLYPESVFPQFYSAALLPAGSPALTVLDAHAMAGVNAAPLPDLFTGCLKASLVDLICREFVFDLDALAGDGDKAAAGRPTRDGILFVTDQDPSSPWLVPDIRAFCSAWEGPLTALSQPAALFDLVRQTCPGGPVSAGDCLPPVVAVTCSPALIVAMLCCGFSVVSTLGLPLYGSARAAAFFGSDLKRLTGGVYQPAEAGELSKTVCNLIGKVPCAM